MVHTVLKDVVRVWWRENLGRMHITVVRLFSSVGRAGGCGRAGGRARHDTEARWHGGLRRKLPGTSPVLEMNVAVLEGRSRVKAIEEEEEIVEDGCMCLCMCCVPSSEGDKQLLVGEGADSRGKRTVARVKRGESGQSGSPRRGARRPGVHQYCFCSAS